MRLVNKRRFISCMSVLVILIVACIYTCTSIAQHVVQYIVVQPTCTPIPSPTIEPTATVVPTPIPTPYIEPIIEKVSRGDTYREEDLMLLAKLIYGEAGSESMGGKLAVGTVVMNRMEHSNKKLYGGPTLKGVIYEEGQFDCLQSNWEEPDKDSISAARQVLEGYRSFRSSIVFYYNPKTSTDKHFIKSIKVVIKIGHHVFGEANE